MTSKKAVHFLLPADYVGSTTRVTVEFANRLVAKGLRVTISVPRFNHLDFVLWHLERFGRTRRNPFRVALEWMRWLFWPLLKAFLFRTKWVGQKIHPVDPRVRVNRFLYFPAPWNMPDADALVTLQCYLVPWLLHLPASKGEIIGSIRVDNLAAIRRAAPVESEWRAHCVAIEKKLNIRLFAVSHQTQEAARALGIRNVEAVISNGINTEEFFDGGRRGDVDPVQITLFTSHRSQKGRGFGCEVVRRLRSRTFPRKVIFRSVGGEVQPEDRDLFDVNFGYLTGPDYARMYQTTDIFIFPSLFEGQAAPPLESMACGCALVTTRVQGLEHFARNEENCLIAAPGDVEALTAHAARLIEDVELRDRLRKAGLQTARRLSWETAADRLVEFLFSEENFSSEAPLAAERTTEEITS